MRKSKQKNKLVLDISDLRPGDLLLSIEITRRTGKINSNVLRDIANLCKDNGVDKDSIKVPDPKSYGKGLHVVYKVPYDLCVKLATQYNKGVVVNQPVLIPDAAPVENDDISSLKAIVNDPNTDLATANLGKTVLGLIDPDQSVAVSAVGTQENLVREAEAVIADLVKITTIPHCSEKAIRLCNGAIKIIRTTILNDPCVKSPEANNYLYAIGVAIGDPCTGNQLCNVLKRAVNLVYPVYTLIMEKYDSEGEAESPLEHTPCEDAPTAIAECISSNTQAEPVKYVPPEIDFEMTGTQATMSTLQIASFFNQLHKNVLADFRKYCENNELTAAEFSAADRYISGKGAEREREVYNLPEDICVSFVSKYDAKLVRVLVQKWRAAENKYMRLTSTLCSDPGALRDLADLIEEANNRGEAKLLAYKAEVEAKLIEQKVEFENKLVDQKIASDVELAKKDAIVREALNDNILLKERYSKLEPFKVVDEIRLPLNRLIAANGLICSTDLGKRVREFLGWKQLLCRPGVEKSNPQPNNITQALIDLKYCVQVPEAGQVYIDDSTGHNMKVECTYNVHPSRLDANGKSWVACRKLDYHSTNSEKYALAVNSTLCWNPTIVGEIVAYMEKLKADKEEAKAKKQKGK